MRIIQFWILIAGSSFVFLLLLKEVTLSREIIRQQRLLAESQQIADQAVTYENGWQKLALRIYPASREDKALGSVLEHQHISVHPAFPSAARASSESVPPSDTSNSTAAPSSKTATP